MELTGKKLAVLGCGRSGIAAARLALAKGAVEVCIFDTNTSATCNEPGVSLVAGATEEQARAYAADMVILSPGIEGDIPWTLAFTAHGAPLIGETELAWHYYGGRIIAITGRS